jgi:dethiobiotin synthetase
MPQPAFFVTGTDTGIGKTTVTLAIAAALRRRGRRVGVAKPFETGCHPDRDGTLIPADARLLKFFAECEEPLETICPIRCREPLAPAIALQREHVEIDLDRLERTVLGIVERHDVTFVEGAGGLLVPVTQGVTFADIAREWNLPLVIVVGNRLGALNHAQLTVRVARQAGLVIAGYVVNTLLPDGDVAMQTNIDALTELIGPSLGVLPYLDTIAMTPSDCTRLADAADQAISFASLDLDARA